EKTPSAATTRTRTHTKTRNLAMDGPTKKEWNGLFSNECWVVMGRSVGPAFLPVKQKVYKRNLLVPKRRGWLRCSGSRAQCRTVISLDRWEGAGRVHTLFETRHRLRGSAAGRLRRRRRTADQSRDR